MRGGGTTASVPGSGVSANDTQAASAVINLDLPWNPAKLEQRIARALRKNQTRSVTVVNLVCEHSIEHGILFLLGQKQALADGILDGRGDVDKLQMPSGRGAFIERMHGRPSFKKLIDEETPIFGKRASRIAD